METGPIFFVGITNFVGFRWNRSAAWSLCLATSVGCLVCVFGDWLDSIWLINHGFCVGSCWTSQSATTCLPSCTLTSSHAEQLNRLVILICTALRSCSPFIGRQRPPTRAHSWRNRAISGTGNSNNRSDTATKRSEHFHSDPFAELAERKEAVGEWLITYRRIACRLRQNGHRLLLPLHPPHPAFEFSKQLNAEPHNSSSWWIIILEGGGSGCCCRWIPQVGQELCVICGRFSSGKTWKVNQWFLFSYKNSIGNLNRNLARHAII